MPHSHGNNNNNNNKQKQTNAPEILLLESLVALVQRRCTKTEVEKHSVRVVELGWATDGLGYSWSFGVGQELPGPLAKLHVQTPTMLVECFRTKRKTHQDWPKEMEIKAVDGSYCPKDANNY